MKRGTYRRKFIAPVAPQGSPFPYSWEIQRDAEGSTIVVKTRHGREVMWIGAEELIGDLGPRNVLEMLKQRLVEQLDDPAEYSLSGDIFAMTEKPHPPARYPKRASVDGKGQKP